MPDRFVNRKAGFTLLEVIVTVALVAILSAIAVFSLAFYVPDLRLKSAAQDVNIQLRKARLEAIRQSRRCYIEFFRTIDGQTFSPFIWMEFEDEDNDPSDAAVFEPLDGDADGLVDQVIFSLPVVVVDGQWELRDYRGIRFNAAFGNADGVTFPLLAAPVKRYYLNTRGISSDAGSIYLRNARGRAREIMVTLGGATRLQ